MKNEMTLAFDSISENEAFARVAVSAFITQLNPTLEEVADIRTAVSEAVTNAIIHGYEDREGQVYLSCEISGDTATIIVEDKGVGMRDVKQALQPFYTTKPDLERSGMGFAFMEAFMDDMEVESVLGSGTKVTMKKKIGAKEDVD